MMLLIKIIVCFFLTLPLSISTVFAATYYVNATGGDDARNTTQAQVISTPWLTIQKCADNADDDDVCMVLAGTYNERVTPANAGSAGHYVTYAAYQGQTVVMGGFTIAGKSYLKIIGFEITNNSTNHGISFSGTCSYIQILNNYFHNTYGNAIRGYSSGATLSYITLRGNRAYYIGCITPTSNCANSSAFVDGNVPDNHWLIEYNTVQRAGDFLNIGGNNMIVRNNYFYDYADSYYTDNSAMHVDFTQPGSDGYDSNTKYHVYESNFWGDNIEGNSHGLQIANTVAAPDTNVVIRGNVIYNLGSYALGAWAIPNIHVYNNVADGSNGGGYAFQNGSTGSCFNNIASNQSGGNPLAVADSTITFANNICYSTGAPYGTTCTSTANPVYVNAATRDYHLQSSSTARNAGRAITTVNQADGSGTTITFTDANLFIDGYGLTTGDTIKIGSNSPVVITSITGNNVTVASAQTWTNGDGVYWKDQDTTPDIGAYEYKAGGYALTGTYTNSGGTVTVTPNDISLVRFVEVFENGLSKGTDFTTPYSVSGIGSGTVTVKIYSLYASATPVITASLIPGGDSTGITVTGCTIQ